MWQDMVQLALLGTERSQWTKEQLEQLKAYGINIEQDSSTLLLEAAARWQVMQQAGFVLEKRPSTVPLSPAIAEQTTPLNRKSQKHLKLILEGHFPEALPEFFHYLTLFKKSLPPELLPALLTISLKEEDLWKYLKHGIGSTGHWLIQQNPDWASLAVNLSIEQWATATDEERLIIFKQLQAEQAAKSIELLEGIWESLDYKRKLKFLTTLTKPSLSTHEAFLQKTLTDSRKEVRQQATYLLAQIENSNFVQHIQTRIAEYLTFDGTTLEVHLPKDLEEIGLAEGIHERNDWMQQSEKTGRLAQLLKMTSPTYWEFFFQADANESLAHFGKNQWQTLLIWAVVEATLLHQNTNWAAALMNYWITTSNADFWERVAIKPLLKLLTAADFNTLLLKHIPQGAYLLDEESPVYFMLNSGHQHWSDELTIRVMKNFQLALQNMRTVSWQAFHYKTLLHHAAYQCRPEVLEKLNSGWNINEAVWYHWQKEIEAFLRTLHFRQQMRLEMM